MRSPRTLRTAIVAAGLLLIPTTGMLAQSDLPATLGASTPELQDDVSEPGIWGLPDAHGTTTDADGAIVMSFTDEGWMWGWRDLAAAHHPVVRVEGSVALDGDDVSGGWMCGASGSLFAFGVVSDDEWHIGHIVDGEVTVDREGDLAPRLQASDGGTRTVSVECGQENVDITRLLLRVDGASVGSANVGPIGPFDRVAFVGQDAGEGAGSVTFDDIAAWSGTRYAPSTDAPSTAGPAATAPAVDSALGADTVAFEDDFSTEGLWGTGVTPEGVVNYADEQLAMSILTDGAARWSWRSIDAASPVLRVAGRVSVVGEGSAGWMCGDAADQPSFLFGVMGASGSWTVGQVVDGTISSIERGTVAAGPPGDGQRHVVLECGDTADGTSRVVLWVDGEQLADVTVDGVHGPYQKATAMGASASSTVFNARFDDVVVSYGMQDAPAD